MRPDSLMQLDYIQQVFCYMLSSQISADQRLFSSKAYIGLPKQDLIQGAAQECTNLTLGEDTCLMK